MAPVPKSKYHQWDGSEKAVIDMGDPQQVLTIDKIKKEAKAALKKEIPDYEKRVETYFEALDLSAKQAAMKPNRFILPEGGPNDRIAEDRGTFGEVVNGVMSKYGLKDGGVNTEATIGKAHLKDGNAIYWEIMQEEHKRIKCERSKEIEPDSMEIIAPHTPKLKPEMNTKMGRFT